MPNIVIAGAQWGDEGKGKFVDLLAEKVQVVARYNGGHNAGHTVILGDERFVLHLLPSGILHEGVLCLMGNGMVIDPWALVAEIDKLAAQGVAISRDNLRIAGNATLILPLHRDLDQLREAAAGSAKIGTTGRGIGPAYEDKVGRRAIRVNDLADLGTISPKVERLLAHHNALRRGLGQPEVAAQELIGQLAQIAPRLAVARNAMSASGQLGR